MNIYDKAHELANLLKNSPEFKNYQKLNKEVYEKNNNKEMIDDFRKKVMEYQMHVMEHGEDKEAMERLQKSQQVLMMNPEIGKFMNAEMQFSMIFQDIIKILEEAIKL